MKIDELEIRLKEIVKNLKNDWDEVNRLKLDLGKRIGDLELLADELAKRRSVREEKAPDSEPEKEYSVLTIRGEANGILLGSYSPWESKADAVDRYCDILLAEKLHGGKQDEHRLVSRKKGSRFWNVKKYEKIELVDDVFKIREVDETEEIPKRGPVKKEYTVEGCDAESQWPSPPRPPKFMSLFKNREEARKLKRELEMSWPDWKYRIIWRPEGSPEGTEWKVQK